MKKSNVNALHGNTNKNVTVNTVSKRVVEDDNFAKYEYYVDDEFPKAKLKNVIYIMFYCIILCLVISGIVILIVYGVVPCTMTKCNSNALCINHPFRGECVCRNGFNGNGKEYCDGKITKKFLSRTFILN